MHAAVRRTVGLLDEARLADWAVPCDERRRPVSGIERPRRRQGELRIDLRRATAGGGLGVAAAATVEVEARANAVRDVFGRCEVFLAQFEERDLAAGAAGCGGGGAGGGAPGARRSAAHAGIVCAELS